MAVTRFQGAVLSLLADDRRRRGESYVAGGVALNVVLAAPRRSRDIDLFHDTEVDTLDFGGERPDAGALGQTWHAARQTAAETCTLLPADRMGTCVLTAELDLFCGEPVALTEALQNKAIVFHEGRIGGSWPRVLSRE